MTSGYNEQQLSGQQTTSGNRIQPIAENLTYTPEPGVNITQSNTYEINGGEQSFQLNAMKGLEKGSHMGVSLGYAPGLSGAASPIPGAPVYAGTPETYTVNTDFGWAPDSSTWHFFFITRSQAVSQAGWGQMQKFTLYDKELTVVKLWHDFIGQAQFLFRPGNVKQVTFNITLRIPAGGPVKSAAQKKETDWESEWYPERQLPMNNRP